MERKGLSTQYGPLYKTVDYHGCHIFPIPVRVFVISTCSFLSTSAFNLWTAIVCAEATRVASVLGLVSRLEVPTQYSVDWGSDLVLQMVAPLLSPVASHNSTFSGAQDLLPYRQWRMLVGIISILPLQMIAVFNPLDPNNTLLPTLVDA